MLHGRADIVEALEQDFLAGRGNFKFKDEAVLVGDSLVRQIHRERIAFLFFGTLEDFVYLLFGERRRKNTVLKAIIVENVGVAGGNDDAEAVVFDAPGSVFAAGTAAEIAAR